jgi:hypothetical protein
MQRLDANGDDMEVGIEICYISLARGVCQRMVEENRGFGFSVGYLGDMQGGRGLEWTCN